MGSPKGCSKFSKGVELVKLGQQGVNVIRQSKGIAFNQKGM
jgi:hypothetical protein